MRAEGPRHEDLPGQLLHRIAQRFSSPATSQRILLPLLADLQFEYARTEGAIARLRVRVRWVLAFWLALGLETARTSGRHLRVNAWGATDHEREAARRLLPRVAGMITALVLVLVVEQSWGMYGWWAVHGSGWPFNAAETLRLAVMLVPCMLCMAIPAGLLLGVVLAAQGRPAARPRWRSLLGIAALGGLGTFVLSAWITPRANQTYRVLVLEGVAPNFAGTLARGNRELSLAELSDRAHELRASGRSGEAARFELEWQKKPALGASCLALALAGAAITYRLRGGMRRWPMALLVLAGWLVLLRIGEQAGGQDAIAPVAAMWGPGLVVTTLALGGLARRSEKGSVIA